MLFFTAPSMKIFALFWLVLLLSTSLAASAQEYKEYRVRFPAATGQKLALDMRGSSVVVEAYEGDELIIKGNGYEATPERAQGLRPLGQSPAADNTHLGLAATLTGNTVRVQQVSPKRVTYTLRVPRRAALVYTETTWNGGELRVTGLLNTVELTLKNTNATLTNVTGPVVANSVSGSITVRFAALAAAPTAISQISGSIDISLLPATKATLALRTMSGEITTDFGLAQPSPGASQLGGRRVAGPLNGGGPRLSLHTLSGNIFVRKTK